jgi:Uma2 family endonuclease
MLVDVSTGSLFSDLPRRRFTVDEVNRMAEEGIIGEDEHVELLDGELVVMSPQGPPHSARLMDLHQKLADAYRGKAHVRSQVPFEARPYSLPEPDLAVIRGQPLDYGQRHPNARDARLVIEVARTSQRIDRRKIGIYASTGVPVYWLIDLRKNQVDVFAKPSADGTYRQHRVLGVGQEIELPGLVVRWPVADLVG